MGAYCSTSTDPVTIDEADRPQRKRDTSGDIAVGASLDTLAKFLWGKPKNSVIKFFKLKKVQEKWLSAFALLCLLAEPEGMTAPQRRYILKHAQAFYPTLDCEAILNEVEDSGQGQDDLNATIKALKRAYSNPKITLFSEYEMFRHSIAEYLMFMYICASGIPLDEIESETFRTASDVLGVTEGETRNLVELLRLEHRLLKMIDAIFAREEVSVEFDEEKFSAATVSESYRGRVGFAFHAQVQHHAGKGMSTVQELVEDYPSYIQSFFSLVVIVAKGDGVLAESEEKFLRHLADVTNVPDIDTCIAATEDAFDENMEIVKSKLAGIRPKVEHGQFGPVMAHFADDLSVHLLRTGLCVAGQDGLARDEVNVVRRMGDRLDVPAAIVDKICVAFEMEQELCDYFFTIFMVRRGASVPPVTPSPRPPSIGSLGPSTSIESPVEG